MAAPEEKVLGMELRDRCSMTQATVVKVGTGQRGEGLGDGAGHVVRVGWWVGACVECM